MDSPLKPAILESRDVSLRYKGESGNIIEAISKITFRLMEGDALAVVGPSGCGKSSLLSLLSGFRPPSEGELLFRGKPLRGPGRERVIIFQDHALFPWATASGNIEFALRARGCSRIEARAEVPRWLELVGLKQAGKLYPAQLSGGMQQRVGIARALAAKPEVLLLDEPFASLDVITRSQVLAQLIELTGNLGTSLVLVTHNIEEALFLGSSVMVMRGQPGKVVRTFARPFPRPHTIRELRLIPGFREAENQVLEDLMEEEIVPSLGRN